MIELTLDEAKEIAIAAIERGTPPIPDFDTQPAQMQLQMLTAVVNIIAAAQEIGYHIEKPPDGHQDA